MLPDTIQQDNMIKKTTGFALGKYSTSLTILQLKIQALGVIQIKKHENPEINQDYEIDIPTMAAILGCNKATLMRNITKSMDALLENDPIITFEDEHQIIKAHVLQGIRVDKKKKKIYIRFAYDFRKYIILMKELYDITYPVQTILRLNLRYSPFLYDFLLAQIYKQRSESGAKDEYAITVTPDELLSIIPYSGKHLGSFNRTVIAPACKEISEVSEIKIRNDIPEIETIRRKIISYTFYVSIKTAITMSLFNDDHIEDIRNNLIDETMPSEPYLISKMLDMHVSEGFIKMTVSKHDLLKIWKSLLYTYEHQGISAKYFNTVYTYDLAAEKTCEQMLRIVVEKRQDLLDSTMLYILREYDKQNEKQRNYIKHELEKAEKNNKPIDIELQLKLLKEKLKK